MHTVILYSILEFCVIITAHIMEIYIVSIQQSRQHTLTTTDFEADRTVDVATSSHRETQELLQVCV